MMFLHPAFLWAVPALLAAGAGLYFWSRRVRRRRLALFVTHADAAALLRSRQETVRAAAHGLVVAGACLLVVALARPLTGPVNGTTETQGIDVLVALDVSKSMLAPDLPPRRLEVARTALLDWLTGRAGDRVGVILFAGESFLQMPLSSDLPAVRHVIESAQPTGRGGSNLANPIQTAIDAFSRVESASRALILVTDGENHEGDPVALATEARAHGIRVYTLGVGTLAGGKVPHIMKSGKITGEVRNSYGVGVTSRLDPVMLRSIAQAGGGAYYSLGDTPDALRRLQDGELARLLRDTRQIDAADYREWYWLPLALGLLCLAGERFLPRLGAAPRRVPVRALASLTVLLVAVVAGTPPLRAQDTSAAAQIDFSPFEKLIQENRAGEAVDKLRELVKAHPDNPYALYNLGVAEYSVKNYAGAVSALENVIGLPGDELRAKALVQLGNAHVRLAEAALAAGRESDAAVEFELALQSYENPGATDRGASKNALLAEGAYVDTLETVAREQLALLGPGGDNWTQRRILGKALGALEQLLVRAPDRASARELERTTREQLVGKIIEAGRKKITDGRSDMDAKRFKNAYVPMRDANALADEALSVNPDDPRARAFYDESRTAFATMLIERGREQFEDAMKNEKLANRISRLTGAEESVTEALVNLPDNPEAIALLASIREEIVKASLTDGDALVAQADKASTPTGQASTLTRAVERFDRVLQIKPDNAHAKEQLAAIAPRLADALMEMAEAELAAAAKTAAKDKPTDSETRAAMTHLDKASEALSQAASQGVEAEKLAALTKKAQELGEELAKKLEEAGENAPPAQGKPDKNKPDSPGGEPKDKDNKGEGGEPKPSAAKSLSDARKVSKGSQNPPPAKDW
jgi:tetratricopeptide (TPR) repeat protein